MPESDDNLPLEIRHDPRFIAFAQKRATMAPSATQTNELAMMPSPVKDAPRQAATGVGIGDGSEDHQCVTDDDAREANDHSQEVGFDFRQRYIVTSIVTFDGQSTFHEGNGEGGIRTLGTTENSFWFEETTLLGCPVSEEMSFTPLASISLTAALVAAITCLRPPKRSTSFG